MMMKDSGVAWIGDVPRNWAVLRTKHVFRNHKDVVGARESEYERLALTLNGVIKRSKTDSNGLQPEKFDGYQIVHSNELIFKLIDLANVSTSRVGLSPYEGIVSPAYIVLYPHQPSCLKFAEYFFYSLWQREVFNHIGDEGVRSSLSADTLLNIPYVCPPLLEQQRIADFLDAKCAAIDDVIAKTNESIEEYKKLKQAVISEAVTKGVRGKRPMKDSGIDWIGQIPKEWQCCKIRYLHKGLTDGTHGTYARLDSGRLLLSSKNVRENELEIGDNESYISEEDYQSIVACGFPQRNDVLMCCIGASIGRCILYDYDEPMAFQRSVIFIRCNSMYLPKMLRYSLLSEATLVQESFLINQSAQAGLYQGSVAEIYVTVPSLDEQREIADYLDSKCAVIDSLIEKKQQFIDELTAYKKSLIYEYVTGKKEVPA